ncbi:hypothetical protein CJ231_05910 [Hoylesella buccalis]|uniref:Uncharacterized protein n=1 Tax=Hoylesella buccalis TaxID=28127 RepID=A0A2N6QR44_9BACT|nr:hypothetical protein CJ231_05910 [Hoylesella buccalis]
MCHARRNKAHAFHSGNVVYIFHTVETFSAIFYIFLTDLLYKKSVLFSGTILFFNNELKANQLIGLFMITNDLFKYKNRV